MPYPLDTLTTGGLYVNPSDNPFNWEKWEWVGRDLQSEWLPLDLLKSHLNIYGDNTQDTYLTDLELATRFAIENYMGRWIFDTEFRAYYPADQAATSSRSLDIPQVHSVNVTISNVLYVDVNNVRQPIASTDWTYDPTGNKIILANAINASYLATAPIIVEYTALADPVGAYPDVKWAGQMLAGHLYSHRNAVQNISGGKAPASALKLPYSVDFLLRPYKPLRL